jgi:tripeptide aminopeptidase
MNINKLKEVLSIQTESYNQFRMFAYLIRQVKEIGARFFVNDGNIYIIKGDSDLYPCIVAHMDSVHEIGEDLTVIQVKDNLTGFNAVTMQQSGIGGDDKVGVFIALECLKKFDEIKIVFFRDEETGCEGSYNALIDFFDDCSFVLQCDRRGNEDFIINASGTDLSSKSFQDAVIEILPFYDYKFNNGMMTDVMALKQSGLNISAANISCGYYNPHSSDEFVNIPDVKNCLALVFDIIENCSFIQYKHKYKVKKYKPIKYKPIKYSYADDITNEKEFCECCMEKVKSEDISYLKSYNMWVCSHCKTFEDEKDRKFNPQPF